MFYQQHKGIVICRYHLHPLPLEVPPQCHVKGEVASFAEGSTSAIYNIRQDNSADVTVFFIALSICNAPTSA